MKKTISLSFSHPIVLLIVVTFSFLYILRLMMCIIIRFIWIFIYRESIEKKYWQRNFLNWATIFGNHGNINIFRLIVFGESNRRYLKFHELFLNTIVRPWHRTRWGQKKRRQSVSVVGSARRRTVASGLVHQPRVEGARVVEELTNTANHRKTCTPKKLSASTQKESASRC